MAKRYDTALAQAANNSGNSLAGAKLNFYLTGTTTRSDTFSDNGLTSANANPVVSDGNGRFADIFLQALDYSVVFTDSADVLIDTQDPFNGRDTSADNVVLKIATLTALSKPADNTVVTVLGHTTDNDLGGGQFRWDSASTTTADSGTIFSADSGGTGRWKRMFITELYPEWFGAFAGTQSGPELQLWIDAVEAQKVPGKFRGLYKNNTTNLISDDRVTILGGNKEDDGIDFSGLTNIGWRHKGTVGGGKDPEESFFSDHSFIGDGTGSSLFQMDASYHRLTNTRYFTTGVESAALLTTDPTAQVNQAIWDNVECRSQSTPGGLIGASYERGANVMIWGGYYGDFDIGLEIGAANFVTNIIIGGGVLCETFITLNSATASACEIKNAAALSFQGARFQCSGALQRGIRISGAWNGGAIDSCSFDGTGVATAMIQFEFNANDAAGLVIQGNAFQSVGSSTTNPIQLDGTNVTVSGATQANPCVITATAHGYANGNKVRLKSIVGMTELNDKSYIIANKADNTFELQNVNSTGFTAYSSAGTSTRLPNPDYFLGVNELASTTNRAAGDILIAVGDPTPNAGAGSTFKTQNSSATTITDLDGIDRTQEKTVVIVFGDALTTIDFTSSAMRGNGGADWSPAVDDSMICTHVDQVWHCTVEPQGTLIGTATWNPGSIADGDEEAQDVTVTGSALGDFVMVSLGVDTVDLTLTGTVTATNTVTAVLANNTGGPINLASSTLTAKVFK